MPGARAKLKHVQIDGGGVMHHRGIMLAGKDVTRTAHVGGELINFVDSCDDVLDHGRIAEISDDEFVGRWFDEIVPLEVHAAYPEPLRPQSLYQMAANESTGSSYENFL